MTINYFVQTVFDTSVQVSREQFKLLLNELKESKIHFFYCIIERPNYKTHIITDIPIKADSITEYNK